VKKVLQKKDGQGYAMLERLLPRLEALANWTTESIDALIKSFCEEQSVGLGDVAQPLRVAIAGRAVSPAIAESLVLLGKQKSINRIQRCLSRRT
jgi:glutamyl-tRNA synthetase